MGAASGWRVYTHVVTDRRRVEPIDAAEEGEKEGVVVLIIVRCRPAMCGDWFCSGSRNNERVASVSIYNVCPPQVQRYFGNQFDQENPVHCFRKTWSTTLSTDKWRLQIILRHPPLVILDSSRLCIYFRNNQQTSKLHSRGRGARGLAQPWDISDASSLAAIHVPSAYFYERHENPGKDNMMPVCPRSKMWKRR